jgi:outer membrane lipoprotein SlyB
MVMNKALLTAALVAGVSVSGCATSRYGDPYYNGGQTQAGRAATGAAVGALGGAAVGAIVPGVSPVTGAIAGGIAGAVLGAVVNNRQYYRDTRGSCYYVDANGRPIYDYNVRC